MLSQRVDEKWERMMKQISASICPLALFATDAIARAGGREKGFVRPHSQRLVAVEGHC